MASYGRQLLKRVVIRYCDRWGSSAGVRDYLQQQLPAFQQQHPHVGVRAVLRRSQHPYVEAEFEHALPEKANRRHTTTVGLRNMGPRDVARALWWLASSQGRPLGEGVPARRVITKRPSIQGGWSVMTFAAQQQQQ